MVSGMLRKKQEDRVDISALLENPHLPTTAVKAKMSKLGKLAVPLLLDERKLPSGSMMEVPKTLPSYLSLSPSSSVCPQPNPSLLDDGGSHTSGGRPRR